MGRAQVITKEIDLSTRVPSFPGVYGGIVIPAKKGPIDKNVLVTNDTQLLKYFTENEKVEVGDSTAFFSALAFLQKSNKLWVRRAYKDALFGGAIIKSTTSTTDNFALPAGMTDPDAYLFDSLPDVAGVAATFDAAIVGVTGNVQLTADEDGIIGNSILLTGDNAKTLATLVSDWNTANPTNAVTLNSANGGDTPANLEAMQLAGGINEVNAVDEAILLYQSNPGSWGNRIAIKLTNYATNPDLVKEPDAFLLQIYKTSNLNDPVESFVCSRVEGTKDGYGNNIFVEDALLASDYVRAISNTAVDSSVNPKDQAAVLTFANGGDGTAITDSEMILAADKLSNKDDLPLTILMDGGHSTAAYHLKLDSIAKDRQDCVAILSIPYSAEASSDYVNDVVEYKKVTLNVDSSYSALYSPHVKIYDQFNARSIYVSPDGYAAAAISESASNYEIWYPPAGFRRGAINVLDLRRKYKSGEMDYLYDTGINPLRFAPGRGIYIWGQKTLSARPSALDRLNVRLLLIVIEPAIGEALEDFLFELNDAATQSLASSIVNSYMDNIKARRGVTDFRVVCDSSNNSDADIDAGRMNLWLFVKPTRSAEEIPFSVVITSSGLSFELAAELL